MHAMPRQPRPTLAISGLTSSLLVTRNPPQSQSQTPITPHSPPTVPKKMTDLSNEPRKLEILKNSNLMSTELVGVHDEDMRWVGRMHRSEETRCWVGGARVPSRSAS